jgi:hypothetical protein
VGLPYPSNCTRNIPVEETSAYAFLAFDSLLASTRPLSTTSKKLTAEKRREAKNLLLGAGAFLTYFSRKFKNHPNATS